MNSVGRLDRHLSSSGPLIGYNDEHPFYSSCASSTTAKHSISDVSKSIAVSIIAMSNGKNSWRFRLGCGSTYYHRTGWRGDKGESKFFFLSYGKRRRARDSIGFGLWRFLPHVPLTTNEWFPCGGPLLKSLPLLLSFAYSGLCVFSVVAGQRVTTKLGRDVIQMENCLEIEQNSHLICFVAAVCTRSSALHRKQSNADALPLGCSPQRSE